MPRNGLTKEKVVAEAIVYIAEVGGGVFSMHTLAARLHVKTASLYNHIPNMDALVQEVCLTALRMKRGRRPEKRQTHRCIFDLVCHDRCLLYGGAVILLSDKLLPFLGTDADTEGYASVYLFWTVGIGAVPTVLNACLAHLIRTEGYSGQVSFWGCVRRHPEHALRPDLHFCSSHGDRRGSHRHDAFQCRCYGILFCVSL